MGNPSSTDGPRRGGLDRRKHPAGATLLAAVLACAVGSTAAAQQGPQPKLTVESVRLMDADRDGRITREEFVRLFGDDQLFAQFDANGDGVLDAAEIRANLRVRPRIVN